MSYYFVLHINNSKQDPSVWNICVYLLYLYSLLNYSRKFFHTVLAYNSMFHIVISHSFYTRRLSYLKSGLPFPLHSVTQVKWLLLSDFHTLDLERELPKVYNVSWQTSKLVFSFCIGNGNFSICNFLKIAHFQVHKFRFMFSLTEIFSPLIHRQNSSTIKHIMIKD